MSKERDAWVKEYGRRCLVLHPRSKRPVSAGWQHGESPATRALNLQRHPDCNLGVLCGDGLAIVDIDPRHGGDETWRALLGEHPAPSTFVVLSGGDDQGRHLYFRTPDRTLPTFSLGPGLEIRARGSQCVAPPSRHPTGGRLYVANPGGPPFGRFAPLPVWIERRAARPAEPGQQRTAAIDPDDVFETMSPPEYARLLCGASADRSGFILCPNPNAPAERTPSLQVFDTAEAGWRCFRPCCTRPDGRLAGGRWVDFYAHAIGFTGELRGADFLSVREMAEAKLMGALGVKA
jgi:Bifunctional DNA primase/polymerase, N-terminal